MVDWRLILSLTNLYMNSINRFEAGATSTPAQTPRAKGPSKLALATAMFAGLATAACGETPEQKCTEKPGTSFIENGTTTSPDQDSFSFLTSFQYENKPICVVTKPGDGIYVVGRVDAIGTAYRKNDNGPRDPLVDQAPVDPLAPPPPFSETFYTGAFELTAKVGEYQVIPWYMDQSPSYTESESLVPQSISVCLLIDKPTLEAGEDGYSDEVDSLRIDDCTKIKQL